MTILQIRYTQAAATTKTIKDIVTLDEDQIKRKIENATEGLPSQCLNYLCNRVLSAYRENASKN
ncbi:MAG: hypothetical protein WAZ77_03955 [Candidatus Nitrosopolaris sp.]